MTVDPRPAPGPNPAPAWAVIGIFVLLTFGAIAIARDFLMPLTMGILLFFVFTPISRALVRIGIPRSLTAGLIVLALIAGLVLAAASLAVPLTNTLENAPTVFQRLENKLESLRGSMKEIQEAAEKIDQMSEQDTPGAIRAETESDGNILTRIARTTPTFFAQLGFTLVLLYFMLASGQLLYLRIVQSFSAIADKRQAVAAMHEIEDSLGSYLGTITLINAGLGVAVGLAMWAWGMPAPALFGIAAFGLNFVPYFGAITGVGLTLIVALVTMPGLLTPVLVATTFFALTSIEGQFVTPHFVSRRLQLNTVVVFITVALWAWLWSVVGMVVAVPMLVVVRVLCAYIPSLRSVGNFIAGEDSDRQPEPGRPARAD